MSHVGLAELRSVVVPDYIFNSDRGDLPSAQDSYLFRHLNLVTPVVPFYPFHFLGGLLIKAEQ